jgi:mycofactocin system transcriptional regulator
VHWVQQGGAVVESRTGRPPATSRGALAQVAIELFLERGFGGTTVDDIAGEAGIARRTFFTYFSSKNDAVWGDFEAGLEQMRAILAASDPDVPVVAAICRAVLAFNDFPPEVEELHRERMELVLHVPALQAHSTLRYAAWRDVVREFAATRLPAHEANLLGHLALGAAVWAYEEWLSEPGSRLADLLREALERLATGWGPVPGAPG